MFLADIDVTGRAGTAAAAKRQQLVHTIVAKDLHDAQPRIGINLMLDSCSVSDN